ncbi:major facilitator superfamily domain-containing protein [Lipomyces tetrasporus]
MAIFRALVVSILIYNFFAYPSFAQKYGTHFPGAGYQLTANGYLVSWFGHKHVLIGALLSMTGFIFILFFSPNIQTLTASALLCGLPFAGAAPAYASELLPVSLRVYFTSFTNMCFIIGQLIAAGVLAGLVSLNSERSYRIPYALHLRRLQSKKANIYPKLTLAPYLAAIVHTNMLEQELSVGTSYWDCFKGFEVRRTEIACLVFSGQITSGLYFAYNSTYFFNQVGLTTDQAYKLNVGGSALALVTTLVNWFAITPYFGRRTAYVLGMGVMTVILCLIAIHTHVWTVIFQLSAGQLGWKTVCLARNTYYLVSLGLGTLEPYFINPTKWNLKGYTGFVWGSTALLTFIWAYYRIFRRTKGRSFDEIDILFAKGVPARKFATYKVDAYDMVQNAELAAHAAHHHGWHHDEKAEQGFVGSVGR